MAVEDRPLLRRLASWISSLRGFHRTKSLRIGLVLKTNLRRVTTLSVGQVTIDGFTITYHGTQRTATNNEGKSVYGGSYLVCVRGGWEALDELPMTSETRIAVVQARSYDQAVSEYPGFLASRRNYDVAQGVDNEGQWRSGILEASWRSGGASTAELAALAAVVESRGLQVVEASAVCRPVFRRVLVRCLGPHLTRQRKRDGTRQSKPYDEVNGFHDEAPHLHRSTR